MLKPHLVLVLFILFLSNTYSQDSNPITIGILNFSGTPGYAELIQSQVADCFSSKSRFITVDRSKLEMIEKERDLQKSEDFIDGYIANQGQSIGAQYLVSGSLISYGTTAGNFKTKPDERGYYKVYTMYKGYLNFSIVIIDVSTGKAVINQTFNISTDKSSTSVGASFLSGFLGGLSGNATPKGYYNTEAQALDEAFRHPYIKGLIKGSVVNKVFPVTMKIIQVESLDKKGFINTVLIKGGEDTDLIKGSDLTVVLNDVIIVDGQEYKKPKEIGRLKVQEVQGEFSICKVVSGGTDIHAKLNEGATMTLNIVSYK